MRAMLLSDLITSKSSSMQMLGISIFVGVFIAMTTGQLVTTVACIAAMVPFVYLFSLSVADEQNGWERFRLTPPGGLWTLPLHGSDDGHLPCRGGDRGHRSGDDSGPSPRRSRGRPTEAL